MDPQTPDEQMVKYRPPGAPKDRVLRGRVDDSDPHWIRVHRRSGPSPISIRRESVVFVRPCSRPDGAPA